MFVIIGNQIGVIAPSAAKFDQSAVRRQGNDVYGVESQKTVATISDEAKAFNLAEVGGETSEIAAGTILQMKSSEQQWDDRAVVLQKNFTDTKFKADSALTKLNDQIKSTQSRIELSRPDMLGKKWDMVLKDGKIEVTGDNLKAKDKQWLENNLNRNKNIVQAAKDVYDSVVTRYDHTKENSGYTVFEGGRDRIVLNVADQINAKLPLRELMSKTRELHKRDVGVSANPFEDAMQVSIQYLQASSGAEAKYRYNNYDMSDATTAAYIRKNEPDLI